MSYLEARKAQNPRQPTDGELDPKLARRRTAEVRVLGGRQRQLRG